MLNNDFKVLVQKYERYKKQQQSKMIIKSIGIGAVALLSLFALSKLFINKEGTQVQKPQITQETTAKTPTKTPVETTAKKETKEETSILKTTKRETNTSTIEINKHNLQITTQGKSLEQLIQNQERLKSYSSTISIAEYHYSKREYQEAVKWAIEASKKDNTKARPWIIYANSKLAAGKIDIAKKALNIYLKKHKSKEAQDLLDKLNSI